MDPEVKEIWLDAMENGGYTKHEGALFYRRADGTDCHCGLGVLVEEAAKRGITIRDPLSIGNKRFPEVSHSRLVPDSVGDWADIDFDTVESRVSRVNDNSDDKTYSTVIEFVRDEF